MDRFGCCFAFPFILFLRPGLHRLHFGASFCTGIVFPKPNVYLTYGLLSSTQFATL